MVCAVAALLALGASAGQSGDPLSPELRSWADDHGPLRVGWVDLPPVSIVTDGQVTGGWGFDAVQLMALKVGVEVEAVVYPDLPAMVAGLEDREIDAIGLVGQRDDVASFATPTEPLGWAPTVLVAGPSAPDATSADELAGGTVTTIPGSPLEARLRELFPDLEPVPTSSVSAGVAAVTAGEIDAYFGPLAVIGYELQQLGARDLRPVGPATSVVRSFSWALPDGEPLAILTAARELVSLGELGVIQVRWTGFDLTIEAPRGLPVWILRSLVAAGAAVLLLGGFSLVLRRRVATATAELRRHQELLEELVDDRTADLARANSDLAETNEALRSFAASAAHDIRSPLSATAGLAEALRSGLLPPERTDWVLGRIEAASRSAADLVSDMLAAADRSPEDDGGPTAALDLQVWLQELFGPQLSAGGGQLTFRCDESVIALPTLLLHRLLANLVGNALKHAGSDPTIDVAVERRDHDWRVVVQDDGDGVPPELADRVFDRGFQADEDRAGVGRGLWFCRVLARRHGGELRLEPSDRGARFVATLPVASSRATAQGAA